MVAHHCNRLAVYTGILGSKNAYQRFMVCDQGEMTSINHFMELLYGIYYCQRFFLYLAIVRFCGCQWPRCMSNSFLTTVREDVRDHGSNVIVRSFENYQDGLKCVRRRSEENEALILAKAALHSGDQFHVISFLSRWFSGDRMRCNSGKNEQ